VLWWDFKYCTLKVKEYPFDGAPRSHSGAEYMLVILAEDSTEA
jgi:hypothetical protein